MFRRNTNYDPYLEPTITNFLQREGQKLKKDASTLIYKGISYKRMKSKLSNSLIEVDSSIQSKSIKSKKRSTDPSHFTLKVMQTF